MNCAKLLPRLVLSLLVTSRLGASETTEAPWPAARAWAWYLQQPWLVGCNFVPSTAVNDVEMWQGETFDPRTMDRELGWAQDLGFNTVRVFLNYVVWEADAAGLKQRLNQFLATAERHGIRTMPILFDDCFKPEPRVGKQLEPEPGIHNSQWVQSPGERRRADHQTWPKLEQYVKDMVGAFGQDQRIVIWDLYNEPSQSLPLVEATFRWAREMKPAQPLTTCVYGSAEMQRRILELSDVTSFHNYGPLPGLKDDAAKYLARGRPVLCTEWMTRGGGSRFETHLPFFKEQRIGCWNWGLVAGRTQTYFPWGSPKGAPEPVLWHHDIFRKDGTPFSEREARLIKTVRGKLPKEAARLPRVIVPTAERQQTTWRYCLERPSADWFKPGFDDSRWNSGVAPFGREEASVARRPNTLWTNADIWLRREFDWPRDQFRDVEFLLHHDEDAELYLNGVLAASASGYNASYEAFPLSRQALAALKRSKNLLAVHCRQTTGGQYIDAGIQGIGENTAEPGAAVRDNFPGCADSMYHGWKSLCLRNGLIELQVVPEIGGRVIQFKLGDKEFFWVNPQLAGQAPSPNGLGPDGAWLNYGGDKLWPAPQGWDNDRQWPGPPDPVLDGQAYTLESLSSPAGQSAIRLTSRPDPRSGIQFSRVLRLFQGTTRVSLEATMKNVDTKPRRWGIWSHTQINGGKPDLSGHNPLLRAWCPINPQSHFPKGYSVIFGEQDNPSFAPDPAHKLMQVQYQYRVGKIGLDSTAGWVATVDGASGAVFVQRFTFRPDTEYPDGSSVEFWLNGLGKIHAYNKDIAMAGNAAENPYNFESEMLSPFAQLQPGESYTWAYDWFACNLGGDYPVVNCSDLGVISEPVRARFGNGRLQLSGRLGVFAPGALSLELLDADGKTLRNVKLETTASPLKPLVLDSTVKLGRRPAAVRLLIAGAAPKVLGGVLARAQVGDQ